MQAVTAREPFGIACGDGIEAEGVARMAGLLGIEVDLAVEDVIPDQLIQRPDTQGFMAGFVAQQVDGAQIVVGGVEERAHRDVCLRQRPGAAGRRLGTAVARCGYARRGLRQPASAQGHWFRLSGQPLAA
ncbi:hypothetical protein CKO42_23590 [Lamprobacter modestohalophilus]|uniref:Uncharacterized protein n=1 Tax=Lamprobacter modestohalophilus TaxID=1064514 RepID=A0A9X0WCW7_9GAMM|nr:hypothetical protein [Lamprobacter modestohalophilus]